MIYLSFCRNSVPQSPNFPLSNLSARFDVLSKVTEMFQLTFPFTTVYPVLGNLVRILFGCSFFSGKLNQLHGFFAFISQDVVPFYPGMHSLSSPATHSHGAANSWRSSNSNSRRKGWRHGEEGRKWPSKTYEFHPTN